MSYKNFDQMILQVYGLKSKRRVVVAGADEAHVIEAVFKAQKEKIIDSVLVGNKKRILEIIRSFEYNASDCEIVDCPDNVNPSQVGIDIINAGGGDFLMKGRIETKELLKPVVDKKNKLYTGRLMTHYTLSRVPGCRKLVSLTDSVIQIYPDLTAKKDMILNAVENLIRIGYERPKVAVICPVEKVNPKIIETLDAEALVEMNQSGEIDNCDIVGPISYDLAMSKESAQIKGYDCPWSEEFDLLVLPNLISANVLGKSWAVTAGGCNAGMLAGARIPITLVSRGAAPEEKFMSIALCALCADMN